jgi:hypothetical protein
MGSYHDSLSSSFGNSSLSSFLSTLLEDEQITSFEIVSDNAKPNQDSIRGLTFVVDNEPPKKCRWNNLVRHDSDPELYKKSGCGNSGRKSGGRYSVRSKPSLVGRRTNSDTNLMMPMSLPKRMESPCQDPNKKSLSRRMVSSDSDLLRIPTRRPSPQGNTNKRSTTTNNAKWNTTSTSMSKIMKKKNMFLDMMIEKDGPTRKPKNKIPSTLQEALSQDLISLCPTAVESPTSWSSASSRSKKNSVSSSSSKLSSDLKKSLFKDLSQEIGLSSSLSTSSYTSGVMPKRVRSKASVCKDQD